MRAWIAAALLVSSVATADKDKKYTLLDLRALVEQKSYAEAIEHLGDVAPSERKAEWQDVAAQAAIGWVDTGKDALTRLGYMIEVEAKFPIVIKHGKYAALRVEVAPKGFEECFANDSSVDECLDHAKKFIDADPGNGKLALAIAKVARRAMYSYNSIPLFRRAVAATKGGATCKDEDLHEAVNAALGLPPDYDNAKEGRELAVTCWEALRKSVVEQLARGEGGYFKDNGCDVMRRKGDRDLHRVCPESP